MSYIVQFIHVTFSTERHVNNGAWMNINNYYLLWWVLDTQSLYVKRIDIMRAGRKIFLGCVHFTLA